MFITHRKQAPVSFSHMRINFQLDKNSNPLPSFLETYTPRENKGTNVNIAPYFIKT